MIVVDAHCHALPHWFEPVEVLLHEMDANGVEKATLVQVRGEFDNGYILDCVRRFPERFCAVVGVDTGTPHAPDELARWAGEGAVGVRLRPGDPLAVWRKADVLGLPVSVFGSADEFASPAFDDLLTRFRSLRVVIEHLGRIGRVARDSEATFHVILALARHPNAYIKVHGLGEICSRPIPFPKPMRFPHVPPFMEMAYDAFGATRMMWGSDFPPVAGREGYRNALRWTMEHIPFRSEADKEAVFGGTALSLFRFAEG